MDTSEWLVKHNHPIDNRKMNELKAGERLEPKMGKLIINSNLDDESNSVLNPYHNSVVRNKDTKRALQFSMDCCPFLVTIIYFNILFIRYS